MAITKLKSNEINPNTDMKNKINEIIDILNGDGTASVNAAAVSAMLNDLPTANVAAPGFYLNSGVVTKGSA